MPAPAKEMLAHSLGRLRTRGQFWSVALVIAAHVAGFVGLQWSLTRPLFQALVPFNLLVVGVLLLAFHRDWRQPFVVFAVATAGLGFLAEVVGVATGWVFGTYAYGPTLGWHVARVPVLIGLNWLVLVYCIGTVTRPWVASRWGRVLLGATLMVLLDVLIEPVAIRHDFWHWFGAIVPWHNYAGWWVVSLPMFAMFHFFRFRKGNPLAAPVCLAQTLFFLAHCLTYWL